VREIPRRKEAIAEGGKLSKYVPFFWELSQFPFLPFRNHPFLQLLPEPRGSERQKNQ
jgi:hypothetical protein